MPTSTIGRHGTAGACTAAVCSGSGGTSGLVLGAGPPARLRGRNGAAATTTGTTATSAVVDQGRRSEEHTSELQSRFDLVCRLLLEKKKYDYNEVSCAIKLRVSIHLVTH